MRAGVDDLTDKEKEALRLLLAGHDAKSSAAQLDLSVHTINDRLRNARRKLGVSSSREAARILGDAEGETPQNPAHTGFGMGAATPADDTAVLTNPGRAGASRLAWLAGGMLVMSIFIAAAIIVLTATGEEAPPPVTTTALETTQSAAASPEDAEVLASADPFLAALDAGDWAASWKAAGPMFQSAVTESEWAANVEPVREPLGKVEERRIATVQRVSSLPGVPEGDYTILQFQTVFARHQGVLTETVVMAKGKDGWEVAGYFIV